MLLVVDIGNTNASFAVFRGRRIDARWSVPISRAKNAAALSRILRARAGSRRIDGVCAVSVVLKLNATLCRACRQAFNLSPLFVTAKNSRMKLVGYPASQLGADRIVGALAAYEKLRRAVIVVDAGTGITFDAVDARGRFLGGAIAPGPGLMAGVLHSMTARLPAVEPAPVSRAIGKSTRSCIESGVSIGAAGLVDRLVDEISREMGSRPLVVATGGWAKLLALRSKKIQMVFPDLVLEGLRILWCRSLRPIDKASG